MQAAKPPLLCSAAKKAKTEPAAAEHKKGTRAADHANQAAKKAAGNKEASVAEVSRC